MTAVYDPAKAQLKPIAKFGEWTIGSARAIDHAARTIDIKRRGRYPHPASLVPLGISGPCSSACVSTRSANGSPTMGSTRDGPYRAARDLLAADAHRGPARRRAAAPPAARASQLAAARRLALQLDQCDPAHPGPARLGQDLHRRPDDLSLLRAGKRVGITANSHKVIGNLLDEVLVAAAEDRVPVRPLQKADEEQTASRRARSRLAKDDGARRRRWRRRARRGRRDGLALGRADFADAVDVLFVDEAGQISLANALAASPAATPICPARRSPAARPADQGEPPAGRRALGARPPARWRRHHRRRPTGLFLATTLAAAPGPAPIHVRDLLRRAASSRSPASSARRSTAPGAADGHGPALGPRRTSRQPQRVARRRPP